MLPDNAFIKDIEKDLGRTFPHHELFAGSTSQGWVVGGGVFPMIECLR